MGVERKDTQFRVVTQGFSTAWSEDTPSNRKAMVLFLRRLEDKSGHALFTYAALAEVVGSSNRQAAHGIVGEFEDRGEDLRGFLERKRKKRTPMARLSFLFPFNPALSQPLQCNTSSNSLLRACFFI